MRENVAFDLTLAVECANAFAGATDLGCAVSDVQGKILHEAGKGCASCRVCSAIDRPREHCIQAHNYGMAEAERFGGKYIYFCPMGFTCFVSPILGREGSEAKITVGPFLMVDRQDFITYDVDERLRLSPEHRLCVLRELPGMPYVSPEKVSQLATLLFMATGFMNNVSAASRMLDTQGADAIQGQITSYIMQLKRGDEPPPYPFDVERALMRAIAQADKPEAQRLLNELFGYIFFSAGRDFEQSKTRVYELLVLISRTAINAGADPGEALKLSHSYMCVLPGFKNMDDLCFWLGRVMNRFMDSVFNYRDEKHADIIRKAVGYIQKNYEKKIRLEEVARMVYLSPAYFSRIFKRELGQSFNSYLNHLRVEKSKEMLLHQNMRMTDIALLVGFEDQSYFSKVFKQITGVGPVKYRETRGTPKR